MRVTQAIALIFLLFVASSFAVEIGADVDSVRILSVSTLIDTDNSERRGSVNGGTRLYIKIVGHDAHVASNNSIFVGPYPCIIPEMGVNEVFITCITTPAYDNNKLWSLPVVVKVVERSDSQCALSDASSCTFSYDGSKTPIVDLILPRSVYFEDDIYWWGNFRIQNTNQIEKMFIGDLLCDRFFLGLNEDQKYNGDAYDNLTCQIDRRHPAGYFSSSFQSKPGKSINRSRLTTVRSSTLDTPYDIQIASKQFNGNIAQTISPEGGIIRISTSGVTQDSDVDITWNGAKCVVETIYDSYLACRLPAGLTNPTVDTSLQFVSGSGTNLKIYNTTSWDLNDLITKYKANPTTPASLEFIKEKIITTTEFAYDYDGDEPNHGRQFFVFTGYFNPPRNGNYQFQTSASYQAKVLLQLTGDSTDESTMTEINNIVEGTERRSPYSNRFDSQKSVSDSITITLEAGKAYYYRIYALSSSAYSFHLSTGVRIPTGNTNKYVNSVSQVTRVKIDYPFTKEKISITFKDRTTATKGTFKINFIDPFGHKVKDTAKQWTETSQKYGRDSTCAQISWHFRNYNGARNSCISNDINDANGVKIGVTWELTFENHRNQVRPTFVPDADVDSPVYTVVTPPGANLSGTFRLKVNGSYVQVNKSSDLSYDVADWNLNSAIATILGTNNIDSSREYQFIDGAHWVFDFYGVVGPVTVEAITAESKLVGEPNIKITPIVENLREASDYLYYPSIETDLLTQRSALPYATIKVNGGLALHSLTAKQLIISVLDATDSASYTGFSDNESTNTLTINGVTANFSLFLSYFKITYNGVSCQVQQTTALPTLTCKYPYKVAGTFKPLIHYNAKGYLLNTGVAEVSTNPVISSLGSTTIYSFGGSDLTITGKFFPTVNSSDLSVTIDSKVAEVLSVSNTQIVVRTPGNLTNGNVNVVVTYKSLASAPSSIAVDNTNAITLTNIDKTLVSPVDKTLITVTGTNFGTDKTKLAAYLDALDSAGSTVTTVAKYQVNIVEANGTTVKILLGGGITGKYRLRVVQIGVGSNNPTGAVDQLEYKIVVSHYSLAAASAYGGGKLVITGNNFSTTKADNQVLVLYSTIDSEFCIITEATSTQITCTLPNMFSHLGTGVTSFDYQVEVWGKLIQKAVYTVGNGDNHKITFSTTNNISVTSLDNAYQAFDSEASITGTNIPTTADAFKVVIVGNEDVAIAVNSFTSTTVKFNVPNLPKGAYTVVLRTDTGDSLPLAFTLYEAIYTLTPTSLYTVSAAGSELSFKMSGNLQDQDPIFKFDGLKATLLSYNKVNGQVKIRLPATTAGSGKKLLSVRSSRLPLDSNGSLPWTTHGTTFTSTAASWTATVSSVSGTDVTITGTNINTLVSAYLQNPNDAKSQIASTTITPGSSTSAVISFANAPAGSYNLYLLNASNGYPTITNNSVKIELPALSSSAVTSSFAGGQTVTITGSRFNTADLSQNVVTICGNQASVVSADASSLVITTPPAYTTISRTDYSFPADNSTPLTGFSTFGNDPAGNSQYLGDEDLLFYYSSTVAGACYAGFNFGNTQVALSKFQLYPKSQDTTTASQFFGTIFQASTDGSTWVDLLVIGTDFHLGKNMYLIDTLVSTTSDTALKANLKKAYSQFRIYDSTGSSKCELVEIQLFGWKQSAVVESGNTLTCPIDVSVNGSTIKSAGSNVVYDKTKTYLVQSISPNYGDVAGGTSITITLDRAVSGTPVVLIDGITCATPAISGSTITCTTGVKNNTAASSLVVKVDGQVAVNNGIIFYYGNLWSKDTTWGSDFPPIAGDLVYVTEGRNLIVDVAYVGVLNTVVVDNASIIFANDKDIHFETNNILVRGGNVVIGTEASPVTGKVRITMHGVQEDKQFPTVGNKGLSVHNGNIDIHGQKRVITWTELSETANVDATEIKVDAKAGFDWAVGEEIVIASTDFSHGHAERRIIKTISVASNIATITFDEPLNVKHVAIINESFNNGANLVSMRAEVGLLTRNVIFEGDESSTIKSYGAHMMLHGAHTSARIRYAEFRRTGQPKIIGRYPIHFHMVGDVTGSIVEGNAVHDSFARVLTIHATHYLQVKNNVGYNCAGHNIFLEDGIETNNVIENNLIIGTRQVWSMLQSDITAASYWITNPLNRVVNNRAAGGDFYGFWYEIKEHPDGPSARNDICPQGMALGQFTGNIAHSYDRFGLRIFVMTNLQYPCKPHRNDALDNPFSDNASATITWSDFVSYRNHEDGVLAEEVGNMVFDNFRLLDNKQSGFNVYLTNRTDEQVILRNSLIVGKSIGNPADDADLENTRGLITPRTDGFKVENVHFANFDKTMTVFKSCSFCFHFKKWVQGGKLTKFSGITYASITSTKKIFWENWRREIYEDLDGSLTGKGVHSWLTPSGIHLNSQSACSTSDSALWDDGVICSKQVVRIEFSNPEKFDELYTKALYVKACDANGVPSTGTTDADFYQSKTVKIKNHGHDLQFGFVGTFLVGQIFSVQWEKTQIDFTHMSVQLSPWHTGDTAADTIVLRFPYTDFRETFENYQMIANKNVIDYKNVTNAQEAAPLTTLLSLNCKHGDWYNHVDGKAMYLCLNGKNRPKATTNNYLERVDVNALKCKVNCPLPPGKCVKDNIPRKLSDVSTWQGIKEDGINGDIVNVAGATTLVIPCPWEILVDQDLTQFTKIIVKGNLRIDPTKDINVKANGIYLQAGSIIAEGATAGSAYTQKLTFELTGNRSQDTQFIIDDQVEVGNKVIANIGSFVLRGNPPATTSARLTASLQPGATTITVSAASGWQVGDSIAIAPTQLIATEHEQFTITAINGNTVTLNTAAKYYHFGAAGVTLTETWDSYTQKLDLRAQVVHLTRNIKIKGAPVTEGVVWGCRVLNYYLKIEGDASGNTLPELEQTHLRGTLDWNGVEMENCGQADTVRGALDFQKCGADADKVVSVVNNSAIHNCPGYCANLEESDYVKITNTNFYNGRPILMRIKTVTNINISNNHFVAAIKRDYPYDTSGMLYDMNTAIYFLSAQDPTVNAILISNNEIQGSEGPCAVLPHVACENAYKISSTLGTYGNQASTCLIGAMYKLNESSGCQWAGKVAVGRATKGLMVNPTRPGIVVEHVLAAESDRSVILRFANEGVRNIGHFQNSAIYGVAITNSADAYDNAAKAGICKNNAGTQNLVVTQGGEDFPLKVMPLAFDVICNSEVFDSSLYQTNVKYVRFRKTYSDPNLALCGNNHMMVTHPSASDATAGTYNTDVTCVDCTEDSYFNFMSPNPSWNGWFGGCGLFLCTGPENVLNVDFTGSLFSGVATTGISHNDGIITSKCKKQANWNDAYSCTGTDYVQLEWESQAPDHNTRSHAPVMLTSLDGKYTNKINMFREWVWDGNEPMNKRENRFLATALVNTVYKVEYNGLNPYNIFHRIQQRNTLNVGEPNKWVIFTSTYQVPMNIEISIDGGSVIDSYLVNDNIDLTTKTNICGANIYDWQTRTVQFVINGSADCLIRAVVLDTVRIHVKVVLKVSEFFNDTTKASFISKIASFLNIDDYSRIKVVGANTQTGRFLEGTTTASPSFELIIDITNKPSDSTKTDAAAVYKDLTEKATKLKNGLDTNTVPGLNPNTYYVTSSDVMVASDNNGGIYGKTTDTEKPIVEESGSDSDNTLAIILGVVIGLVVVTIAIVGYCAYKRYQQKKAILQVQHAEIDHSVDNAPQRETAKVHPVALDPANDQLQEKANCSSAPFQC